jgi:lipopolysaccharide transport system permease protein
VFSVFFGRLAKIPSDGLPYPLFVLCALLPWQLFSYALTNAANSLVADARLITRVYFPRIIIPLSTVVAGLVDFAVAFALLLIVMTIYGHAPSRAVLALPLFIALALAASVAVGVGLAALNVSFRDVRYTLPFLTQLWMLATPIAYPSSLIPPVLRPLYGLNPMAGVVEGFRWSLLATAPEPPWRMIGISIFTLLIALVFSARYFFKVDRTVADIV